MQCIAKSKIFYAKILCNSKNIIWCKKQCLFKKLCFLKCKELQSFLKRNILFFINKKHKKQCLFVAKILFNTKNFVFCNTLVSKNTI